MGLPAHTPAKPQTLTRGRAGALRLPRRMPSLACFGSLRRAGRLASLRSEAVA